MPNVHNIRSRVSKARNFYFPASTFSEGYSTSRPNGEIKKHMTYYITRVQFQRIRQDIQSWRHAVQQAEQYYYPWRSEMQRIFMDTILNEHVSACMRRRKNLSLLRDFKIVDDNGNEDESLKLIFRNKAQKNSGNWFSQFINYTLDALFYGYSLIELGDVENNAFPTINIVRRENVSPDRHNVSSLPQMVGGLDFLAEPYVNWHVWVPTPGETGREASGYGLLYKIAKSEIYLRNNTAFNADFNELFGQPIRKGSTTKTDPDERNVFENALKNMGSSAYILVDEGEDKVELIESKNAGTAHATYSDFEVRMEKKITELVLGHQDAISSTPGKIGGQQKGSGQESPQDQALDDIQLEDGIFVENVINGELIPRMQAFGFPIPPNFHFEFVNTREQEELEKKENETNQIISTLVLQLSQAGYQVDPTWITQQTEIPLVAKPEPVVPKAGGDEPDDEEMTQQIKNLLRRRNIPITLNGNGKH